MNKVLALLTLSVFLSPLAVGAAPEEPEEGVVVEKAGSAGEIAGIRAGDQLLSWSRGEGNSGLVRSLFDLHQLEIEQAPRGAVILHGLREGLSREWTLPPGLWEIEARPTFPEPLLALYEQGRDRIAAGAPEAGARRWRSAIAAADQRRDPLRAAWLQGRLAQELAGAGRWTEAVAAIRLLCSWNETLQKNLDRAEACYRRALALEPEEASPRIAALRNPQPLKLADARAALDPGTVLLEYAVGPSKTWLFVVEPADTPGPGLSAFPVAAGQKALRGQVESFRRLLNHPGSSRKDLQARARQLYDLLIRPAAGRIAGAQRILVSPDGPLHTLPFAVLMHGNRYLVEEKPIHSVLSATVYAELKRSRPEGRDLREEHLVAFGDPKYPSTAGVPADPELRDSLRRGLTLKPLPSTRKEVTAIASLYPQAQAYLGPAATEEKAKSLGLDSRLIHFACHGLLDERFPLSSALALSVPEHPAEGQDNGLLQAWEIFESVHLDADLVTLSACDTALGKEMGGEGLVGLTRAFQYAGARSVLASLWGVADYSTARFMERFYHYLRDGKSKDEALRAAQIDQIRQQGGSSHPFFWAAFELNGDWR